MTISKAKVRILVLSVVLNVFFPKEKTKLLFSDSHYKTKSLEKAQVYTFLSKLRGCQSILEITSKTLLKFEIKQKFLNSHKEEKLLLVN